MLTFGKYTCYSLAMKIPKQPTETTLKFSNRLKLLRTQKGFSQGELATRAGITRQAVSAIESNLYLPTTAVALHLASVLACRVEDLFSLTGTEDIVEGKLIGHLPHSEMKASPIRVKVSTVGSKTVVRDRKSTRLNSSHSDLSRMPSSA